MGDEADGVVHPSLDALRHERVFKVASVEEAVVTRRLVLLKEGLRMSTIITLACRWAIDK